MRWNGSSELKLDVAWRKELSIAQKLTIDALQFRAGTPL